MSARRHAATGRILAAAVQCVRADGAANLSMQHIAAAAGVSKALIHYHFTDKDALLAHVVEWLAARVVERERALLAESPVPIDALWAWLEAELALGELRVLAELSQDRGPAAHRAAVASARLRRASTKSIVESLFKALDLTPRIPSAMMAGVVVAFVDGLALSASLDPEANPRVAFDVFWLSMLSLAE